jgi:hypothetical protein
MDPLKYPVEKLIHFVAGVIPGLVVLLVYNVATPSSFAWFFSLGFLGYRMKLTVIILVVFIFLNSMKRFRYGFFSMLGGAYGGYLGRQPYQPPHTVKGAPWRDARWRIALKRYLGADAPNDTILMSDNLYKLKLQFANSQPAPQVQGALLAIDNEKLGLEIDDSNWARWYEHFHSLVLNPPERDFLFYVEKGLNYNLQTASVYVLVSACFVRAVRHWWVLTPVTLWTFFLLVEEFAALSQWRNKHSTTSKQITYLTELSRKA